MGARGTARSSAAAARIQIVQQAVARFAEAGDGLGLAIFLQPNSTACTSDYVKLTLGSNKSLIFQDTQISPLPRIQGDAYYR